MFTKGVKSAQFVSTLGKLNATGIYPQLKQEYNWKDLLVICEGILVFWPF